MPVVSQTLVHVRVTCVRGLDVKSSQQTTTFDAACSYYRIRNKVLEAFGEPSPGRTWKLWFEDSGAAATGQTTQNQEFELSSFPRTPPQDGNLFVNLC